MVKVGDGCLSKVGIYFVENRTGSGIKVIVQKLI